MLEKRGGDGAFGEKKNGYLKLILTFKVKSIRFGVVI